MTVSMAGKRPQFFSIKEVQFVCSDDPEILLGESSVCFPRENIELADTPKVSFVRRIKETQLAGLLRGVCAGGRA